MERIKIIDTLNFEELKFIHENHNLGIDCDCEECREYRRQAKALDEACK